MIPRRFNGPPDSGHGGYSAGLAAGLIDGPAEVTLLLPPPLDRPLAVRRGADGSASVLDGDRVVMVATPLAADLALTTPAAQGVETARDASAAFHWHDDHPFPTCFGCGPQRAPGDGLRLFAGRVAGNELLATTWTPTEPVDQTLLWAALDCPSGAAGSADKPGVPVVLGRFAVRQLAPVPADAEHEIISWLVEADGRKRLCGCALFDAGGRQLAVARATWIELRRGSDSAPHAPG